MLAGSKKLNEFPELDVDSDLILEELGELAYSILEILKIPFADRLF